MGPSHQYPPYEHRGPWFERAFYHEVEKQQITFPQPYLVGFWTDFLEAVPGKGTAKRQRWRQRRVRMGDMLRKMRTDLKMFTVVQHDDGLYHPWPPNLTVFGAGGVGNVPVPLLMPKCPIDLEDRPRPKRVTWMGKSRGPNNRFGVRSAMLHAFKKRPEFVDVPVTTDYAAYCDVIKSSAFALCPAGYGLTSFRLYEVLSLGTVPVYIHNGTPWLPFSESIDWDALAVLVAPDEIVGLPDRLNAIDEGARKGMLEYARSVFYEHFVMAGVVRRVRDWLETHGKTPFEN